MQLSFRFPDPDRSEAAGPLPWIWERGPLTPDGPGEPGRLEFQIPWGMEPSDPRAWRR